MHALVLDVGDRDRNEQDEQREVPDPRLIPARGARWRRCGFGHGLSHRITDGRFNERDICQDNRHSTTIHLTGRPPRSWSRRRSSQTASWSMRTDRVALVEFELGRDADPAGDPLAVPGEGRRDRQHRAMPVGAGRRQPAAVGAECQGMHGAAMLQGRADRQAGAGIPEPGRPVLAPRRDDRAVVIERQAIDRAPVRQRLADRPARPTSQSRAVPS